MQPVAAPLWLTQSLRSKMDLSEFQDHHSSTIDISPEEWHELQLVFPEAKLFQSDQPQSLPWRAITKDSAPHSDTNASEPTHGHTVLMYVGGDGYFHRDNGLPPTPIAPGLALHFPSDEVHYGTNTSGQVRYTLGPMDSTSGVPVGDDADTCKTDDDCRGVSADCWVLLEDGSIDMAFLRQGDGSRCSTLQDVKCQHVPINDRNENPSLWDWTPTPSAGALYCAGYDKETFEAVQEKAAKAAGKAIGGAVGKVAGMAIGIIIGISLLGVLFTVLIVYLVMRMVRK